MTDPRATVVVVLAAGTSSRFGGPKLLADLGGRPILARVLDVVGSIRPRGVVLVLGNEADRIVATPDLLAALGPVPVTIVRNEAPEEGMARSVRLGFEAAARHFPEAAAALVVLGDQPLLRPEVVMTVLGAGSAGGRPVVAPRYERGGGANPVLLRRDAWDLTREASGDRGLGPVLAARPELVAEVAVSGDNPDVDTPVDLALAAWARRVRADHAQVDRFREVPDSQDFYGPVSSLFRADPHRTDDETLTGLLELARPEDVWLDIGAGAGRFALPLALRVREVVAVDPSAGMLGALRELAAENEIANISIVEGRWPLEPTAAAAAGVGPGSADVALIAHLGYDVEEIGPFLEAMEAAARRRCVAVLMDRQPSSIADPLWPEVHGEERIRLPALRELVALLEARGRAPRVREVERPPRGFDSFDDLAGFVRRQTWVAEGTVKDERLVTALRGRAMERDGRWFLETQPAVVGIVDWAPR
jgi:CTP:molybdopterin cytidylyltransferase MocA/SAM-dependent methyltransferase